MAESVRLLTLKVTILSLGVARKRGLGFLFFQLIQNLAVGNVTDLVVFVLHYAFSKTHAVDALGHHGVARVVCLAHVAVYTLPALFARAIMTLAR